MTKLKMIYFPQFPVSIMKSDHTNVEVSKDLQVWCFDFSLRLSNQEKKSPHYAEIKKSISIFLKFKKFYVQIKKNVVNICDR